MKFEVSYHFNGSYSTQFCCEVENVFFFTVSVGIRP